MMRGYIVDGIGQGYTPQNNQSEDRNAGVAVMAAASQAEAGVRASDSSTAKQVLQVAAAFVQAIATFARKQLVTSDPGSVI